MTDFSSVRLAWIALTCGSVGLWSAALMADNESPPPSIRADVPVQAAPSEPAYSQEIPAAVPVVAHKSPFDGDLWERPVLLGSLGGFRDEMAENGYSFKVSTTQFYQGITTGGVSQEFAYAGRNDYLFNIDGAKAGLWEGFIATLHGETRYGETVNSASGAIAPPNGGMLFPLPQGSVTALTGVKLTQVLSENLVVFGGKLNLLDDLIQPFAGGRGVDTFMNTGLVFPMTATRTLPYSTLAAGFAVLEERHPFFTFMVLDTKNSMTTSGFESFFENGVTVLSKIDIPVSFRDLPGHQGFWGTYSNGHYNNLQPTAYIDPNVGPVVAFGQDTGSWAVFYAADQALYVDPSNPKRSWGLFTNIGLADNGPSPVRWSANVGLGGSSPFVSRPLDTFGIGYSYIGYSSPVKDLAPVLLPVRDDQAVELYYNYAVTPWFRLTPDLQVLIPARERTLPPGAQAIDTALAIGLRAKIDF